MHTTNGSSLYCPWIGGCIGYRNQAHFIRFLVWTTITSWTSVALLLTRARAIFNATIHGRLQNDLSNAAEGETQGDVIVMAMMMVIMVPIVSIISMLTWNAIDACARNVTTIEQIQMMDHESEWRDKSNDDETNPWSDYCFRHRRHQSRYDMGSVYKNLQAVLAPPTSLRGSRRAFLFWFFPAPSPDIIIHEVN